MSDSSEEEAEKRAESERTAEELSSFLAKVDEIGDLVHNLATSSDKTSTSAAIRNADDYLCRESKAAATGRPSGLDRTVINRDPPRAKNTGHGSAAAAPTDDMGEFCKVIEEDARERAEARKERERQGKELKRKGTQAFRRQEFQAAADNYSEAIKQTPWDISLYTNLALCHNKLGRFEEAIKVCDTALKYETQTLRAYVHKGRALGSLKRYNEAEACYSEAVKLFPSEKKELESYLEELAQLKRENGHHTNQ